MDQDNNNPYKGEKGEGWGDNPLSKGVKGESKKILSKQAPEQKGLTAGEAREWKRKGQHNLDETERNCRRWLIRISYIAVDVLIIAIAGFLIFLLGFYGYDIWQKGTFATVVERILIFIFGAAFTLSVEFLIRRRK